MTVKDILHEFKQITEFLTEQPLDAECRLTVDCPDGGASLPIELNILCTDIGIGDQKSTVEIVFWPTGKIRFDVLENEEEDDCE
jgi:hypothetical protein